MPTGNANGMRKYPGLSSGERNGRAQLTSDQAAEIKARIGDSLKTLAREFGVSTNLVYRIQAGKRWPTIEPARLPNWSPPPKPILSERNLSNVEPIPEAGCWIWLGKLAHGYGQVTRGRSYFGIASRLFYQHYVGEIPDGMLVCHKCDTRSCVNPDHLFLGTHQDNMDDMVRKGRAKSGSRKLDAARGRE